MTVLAKSQGNNFLALQKLNSEQISPFSGESSLNANDETSDRLVPTPDFAFRCYGSYPPLAVSNSSIA